MAARPEAATVRADAAGGPSASAARSPVSPITRARRQQRTARATSSGKRRYTEWECSGCWKTNWMTARECRGCSKVRERPSIDRVVPGRDATWLDEQDAGAHVGHSNSPAAHSGTRARGAPSAAAQLSEARDQVAAAEAAGFPRGALCLMREHVTVLERQQREAMPISAQLDSARATIRKAEQAVEKAEGALQSAQERLINAETDLGRAFREYDELVKHAQTLPAGATTTPMDTEGQDMGAHFASSESSSSASSSAQTISSGGPTQMQQLQQRFQHLTQTMVRAPEAAAAAAESMVIAATTLHAAPDLDDVLEALTQTMVIVLNYLESQQAAQPL